MIVLRGRNPLDGEVYDLHLDGGVIRAMTRPDGTVGALGGEEYWVAPGLIDLQVNGYKGHDFCSPDVTVDDVVAVTEALADAGVTAFCPTVTTNSYAALEAAMRAIAAACERHPVARDRILGIHLEGPYISPEDGPRGAHPLAHVRAPDWDEFRRLQAAAGGRIRIVTLAPELPGALEFIARAREQGLVVSLGHHAASREQISAAVAAGAVLCTHLGNGAHNLVHRHNNYIWEQLANDALMASIIVDGHHLPPAVVKSFVRVKGAHRLILVSDVVAVAGLPPGHYRFMDLPVEVRADGSVRLEGTPYLAGSALKLCDAIDKLIAYTGASLAEAVMMATETPARLLGVHHRLGSLRAGAASNLILLTAGERHELALTVAGGEICYRA